MNKLPHPAVPHGTLQTDLRAPLPSAPSVRSATLLQGHSVVHIEHNGALYQLRSTRLGKLILTK